jgi:ATP-binding cassette subfamily B multidrug efflux pump
LLNVILLAVVIFSFGQREMGAVEVGVLYAFISYIARVVEPLIQITMQFSGLQQAVVATARVAACSTKPAPPNTQRRAAAAGRAWKRGPMRPAVRVRDLSFAYVRARTCCTTSRSRSRRAPSSASSATPAAASRPCCRCCCATTRPKNGSIEIHGEPLAGIDNERFRNEVGLVPQDPFMLAASARENIDMGRGLSQDRIEAAARAAHAHDFIAALEQGYDTSLGEGGSRLSSGQKQLIAIARALAGEPRILLLDEATSRIDSADRADRAGGAGRAARHGDHHRDRAPAVDHPRRRPHRRAEPRPHQRSRQRMRS